MSESKGYHIYLAVLANGHIYTGYTSDLARRIAEHLSGKPSTRTTSRTPVHRIIHTEFFVSKHEAILREAQIKRWSRAKKIALAEGRLGGLKSLACRRSP